MDTAREGEPRANWESSTDVHTLSCVKQITSGKLLCDIGSPAWGSVSNWTGGMGYGGSWGRGDIYTHIYVCIFIYNYDQFALMYGRDHHIIVKQLSFQKKKTHKEKDSYVNIVLCLSKSKNTKDWWKIEARIHKRGFYPRTVSENLVVWLVWFQISSLWGCETINFRCFKTLWFWYFVIAVLGK